MSLKTLSAELLALGYTPVVATEIEFYLCHPELVSGSTTPFDEVEKWMLKRVQHDNIHKIEKERGEGQYEIALKPVDAMLAAEQCRALKDALSDADFRAKPFPDQPGSGLHVHVHLEQNGKNVFWKRGEEMSDALKWSLGGLLATMQKNMHVFAPTAESRTRFQAGSNAPMSLSWGANNRTCALRLPDSGQDQKWIEHRVSGADADPEAVIAAVLGGIVYGLENKCDPGPQIFGDASLEMYGLPKLL